ncbi:DUF5908 family protein [Shewanella sp. YLB-07]|uniref:DUF5908 family protein n=1 Tax=Shewanella sp. YLB-07 TaxID=2601268 RepID=UPI00128C22A1|nr:DUF5908 family protein [Shewanella sp. YLB-07]MPY24385.1 hypothetical protein [Shewanella sp. YLB-07]
MTIEIRELVIQACVRENDHHPHSITPLNRAQRQDDDNRWVELISQRVMKELQDEMRRQR